MPKGLGKGINALFSNVDLSEETVEEIKLQDLRPNPYQPRKTFDDQSLKDLMRKHESTSKNPVKIEDMSDKTMRQINGIIGFEIEISNIQAAYKLSQNRDNKNHKSIISELEKIDDPNTKAIANEMKKNRIK